MNKVDKKIAILIFIVFIITAVLGNQISNFRQLTYDINYFTVEDVGRKIITGMLGEFGKTIAAYIWIKSDFYWHEYEGDWRSDKNIMPLIRIVTMFDPNMAQAYEFGGYHLAINLGKVKEGVAYLKEGLRNNPDNAGINYTYAFVSFKKVKNYYAAIKYAKRAFALSEDKIQKMNCLRIIYNSYEKLGNYKSAIYIAGLLSKMSPQDLGVKWKIEYYKNKLGAQTK